MAVFLMNLKCIEYDISIACRSELKLHRNIIRFDAQSLKLQDRKLDEVIINSLGDFLIKDTATFYKKVVS
jgi:hypothetical protein